LKLKHNISERQLIQRCRKGDTKAQFTLYKQYYKGMYNVALRILNDTAEAEDIMQEAFLAAFDKLELFSGEVPFGAWLKKIVVNRSLDALRKRKMLLEDIDEQKTALIEEDTAPENTEEKLELIKYVLAGMSEKNRVLLSLHLIEGYSHEEIADILEMKHGAVRVAYLRAKKKLQEELAKTLSA